jgi:hypothetical protein
LGLPLAQDQATEKWKTIFFGRSYEHRPTASGRFTHILGGMSYGHSASSCFQTAGLFSLIAICLLAIKSSKTQNPFILKIVEIYKA